MKIKYNGKLPIFGVMGNASSPSYANVTFKTTSTSKTGSIFYMDGVTFKHFDFSASKTFGPFSLQVGSMFGIMMDVNSYSSASISGVVSYSPSSGVNGRGSTFNLLDISGKRDDYLVIYYVISSNSVVVSVQSYS